MTNNRCLPPVSYTHLDVYKRQDVNRVMKLIDRNEYKRRQSPVGVRITDRGFGKDRRYPITVKLDFDKQFT